MAVKTELYCNIRTYSLNQNTSGSSLSRGVLAKLVAGIRPGTLLKKRLLHSCFPVSFVKFLRTPPFYIEHLWWLLPYFKKTLGKTFAQSISESIYNLQYLQQKISLSRMAASHYASEKE